MTRPFRQYCTFWYVTFDLLSKTWTLPPWTYVMPCGALPDFVSILVTKKQQWRELDVENWPFIDMWTLRLLRSWSSNVQANLSFYSKHSYSVITICLNNQHKCVTRALYFWLQFQEGKILKPLRRRKNITFAMTSRTSKCLWSPCLCHDDFITIGHRMIIQTVNDS